MFCGYYRTFQFLRFLRDRESAASARHLDFAEMQIPESSLRLQVYGSNRQAGSALILLPGLHPHGIEDRRFKTLADSCARAGFLVIAPDLKEFRELRITPSSIDAIADVVNAIPELFSNSASRRVGMLGISYGTGPMMIAATRANVKARLSYIVSVGGYYDLRHAIECSLTAPQPWGRMIFTLNHAQSLLPDAAEAVRECLALRLNLKETAAQEKEKQLSADAAIFLKRVLEGFSPEQTGECLRILRQSDSLMAGLSPASYLADLDPELKIYLLHGRGDDLVPFAETLELSRELQKLGHRHVKTLITGKLGHADPSDTSGLLDFFYLARWTRGVLSEARR